MSKQNSTNVRITRNGGMESNILARLVPIEQDRMEHDGLFHKALTANSGCELYLPGKNGEYETRHGTVKASISGLMIGRMQRRSVYAIEIRKCRRKNTPKDIDGYQFYCYFDVKADLGYDYRIDVNRATFYKAQFAVQIMNPRLFINSFGLSTTRPQITVAMVEEKLAPEINSISGNSINELGQIDQRPIRSAFNKIGLYIVGNPYISGFERKEDKEAGKILKEMRKEVQDLEKEYYYDRKRIVDEGEKQKIEQRERLVSLGWSSEEIDIENAYIDQSTEKRLQHLEHEKEKRKAFLQSQIGDGYGRLLNGGALYKTIPSNNNQDNAIKAERKHIALPIIGRKQSKYKK